MRETRNQPAPAVAIGGPGKPETRPRDYKSTLNLPKTDFPMKADLPNREPRISKRWQEIGLYATLRKRYKTNEKFILHDGPPYANGSIHMGHALNKILKDIVVRYKTMRGYDAPYVPGWDCHGLPVEHQLFKELKITKYDIDQVHFRSKAYDYAMKYVGIQTKEFRGLGILGGWEKPYLTLSKDYEAEIVRAFGKLVEKGYIYKDLKPVNWCATCETALAEAEVEYEDKISPSIYVKFESVYNDLLAYFIIWTTTPWTLVSNVAIAVRPEADYALCEIGGPVFRGERFIMANDLLRRVLENIGVKDFRILKTIKGKELEGLETRHPFIDRKSKVVLAEYVSMEEGTGCVHTAPGHGQEDYLTGKRYGLPTIMPVDSKGRFDATAGEFSGIDVHKANLSIIEKLKSLGALVRQEELTHSYPHCWRCKRPIIFRATNQYFMKIDHNHLRLDMLKLIESKVKWIPDSGSSRISAMVANRPDWCLSRQRYWGVPIIAFYCRKCRGVLLDARIIEHVAGLVEKEGSDCWFIRKEEELLPKPTRCGKCGSAEFEKETDIIDVWFDSGVSHQAVLKKDSALAYPADLYLEGSDQHRGWFQSALITAMAIDGRAPYKSVLTHGFVVDGEGKKMSKSLGNVITPEQVMKHYGADILRLWAASSDYSEDVRLSDEILTRLADAYRKIRNTYKYLLSNLFDFNPERDSISYGKMLEIDRWVLSKLSVLIKETTKAYDDYAFHKAYRDVYNFCIYEISSVYLDILKDRMYTYKADSLERRSGQTAMFEILLGLLKVMAPLLVFTADEAFGFAKMKGKGDSVHMEAWPNDNYDKWYDETLNKKWELLIDVRNIVLKKLEDARQANLIGSSLEARVILVTEDSKPARLLKENRDILRCLFIVSQVELKVGAPGEGPPDRCSDISRAGGPPIAVYIEKAKGSKCQRCWNYSEAVGVKKDHPTLCERCVKNI